MLKTGFTLYFHPNDVQKSPRLLMFTILCRRFTLVFFFLDNMRMPNAERHFRTVCFQNKGVRLRHRIIQHSVCRPKTSRQESRICSNPQRIKLLDQYQGNLQSLYSCLLHNSVPAVVPGYSTVIFPWYIPGMDP